MPKSMRTALYLICAANAFFAVAFFLQLPFATQWWPFQGTTPLTFIFVSSILAAASASMFWTVASGNNGALAGVGLDYLAILGPMGIYALQLSAGGGTPQLTAFAVTCLLAAVFGLGLLLWSLRHPLDGTPPMPNPVRWSFVVFILALLLVSTRLIMQVPNTMPWAITPEISVVIGWIFFGAATYFAYALLRPSWRNSAGQLAGFLAYDLVLIVPFLTRLPSTPPEFRTGLILYTIVVTYSGLLALYYLFIHKPTRVLG